MATPISLDYGSAVPASVPAGRLFVIEAASSVCGNFLQIGVFFYTTHLLGWSLKQNFLLSAGQGLSYVVGALSAHPLAKLGRQRILAIIFATMAAIIALPLVFCNSPTIAICLLFYTLMIGITWPILESLLSANLDPQALSRRLGLYNIIWAATGAIAVACSGAIISRFAWGIFAIPCAAHAFSALALATQRAGPVDSRVISSSDVPVLHPEPQLLAIRTLALWLSRIALPATYVVIYSLAAMMPTLPVIQHLNVAGQTFVGSTWMVARFVAFLLLSGLWWHTRPRALLAATAIMLLAFLAITVPASRYFGVSATADLTIMIAAQIALGFAMGLIYTASLYFGMVLSEGSTEHGGYHEALIGLGCILGPGAGAAARILAPDSPSLPILGVAGLILLSLVASVVASALARDS
ncbi:MAG TPA: MFS transporter [Tepidisphaeraceae bacterium]|jgi:hypothetical protein